MGTSLIFDIVVLPRSQIVESYERGGAHSRQVKKTHPWVTWLTKQEVFSPDAVNDYLAYRNMLGTGQDEGD